MQHRVKIMEIYYRIVIGTIFVKLTSSPKRNDLTKHLFDVWNKCVEKLKILSHRKKKNSSNQLFINFFSKTIAFTKFLGEKSVRENFEYFCKFTNFCLTLEIFRENEFRDFNAFRKSLLPRNFCQQCV